MATDEPKKPKAAHLQKASEFMKKPVDTIDIFSKIVIPVILTGTGVVFTYLKYNDDKTRLAQDKIESIAKQNADSDANFIQMIVAGGDKLRLYGYDMLKYHSLHMPIPDDLLSVLGDLCHPNVPKIDPDQQACSIISRNEQVASTQQTANQAETDKIKVFLQIASEGQRTDAITLKNALASNQFSPEDVELVKGSVATVHTYVRFFSATGALQASRVKNVMDKLGYKDVGIQDFSSDVEKPLSLIEVWIGKSQGSL